MAKAKQAASRKKPGTKLPAQARRRFVEGLLVRGEVAVKGDGELPEGTTHVMTEKEGEPLVIKRVRFSLS